MVLTNSTLTYLKYSECTRDYLGYLSSISFSSSVQLLTLEVILQRSWRPDVNSIYGAFSFLSGLLTGGMYCSRVLLIVPLWTERFQERSQPNATDEDGLFHGLTGSLGLQASSVPTCSVQVRPHLVSYLVSYFPNYNYITIAPRISTHVFEQLGRGPITRRSFPREAFPRDDAQEYVSARCDSRAETYHCASARGNASRGKDRRVTGPQPNSVKSGRREILLRTCSTISKYVK